MSNDLSEKQLKEISTLEEEIRQKQNRIFQIYENATFEKFNVHKGQTIRIIRKNMLKLATVVSGEETLRLEVRVLKADGKLSSETITIDPEVIVERL